MIGTTVLTDTIASLLAADTAILANTDANKLFLVANSFSPGPNTSLSDLTLAITNGLAGLVVTAGTQLVGRDPLTNQQTVILKAPAGGFFFQLTSAPTVPIIIYGFALLDNDAAIVYGSDLLIQPVTLSASGDFVEIGNATFAVAVSPLS